jgi:5-oxoprolinase (ATP-hydrolysing) subunit A
MLLCDINCDMGEGMPNDEALMPFITSANIACGYHAGDEATMRKTIQLCIDHNVAIGAHPSFPDKENFGRTEMECTPEQVKTWIKEQVIALQKIAHSLNAELHHVKPHGALYNMAARNKDLAKAIAEAVREVDEDLELFGLSGSVMITEAKALGLKTKSEVFADRTYQEDGSLTPRSKSNAMIEDEKEVVPQALGMVQKGIVKTVTGKQIPIVADTICIHGDGDQALLFAQKIHEALTVRQEQQ